MSEQLTKEFEETLSSIDKILKSIDVEDRTDGIYWGRLECAKSLILDVKHELNARNKLLQIEKEKRLQEIQKGIL